MLVLGIDTAGRRAGATLLQDDEVIAMRSSTGPHSTVLLPAIAELLASQERDAAALDLIGVARGPGAYTGLRIGTVTAKTLGWAAGATVLGIPTLVAMASQAPDDAHRVLVALHSYKKRLLFLWFERDAAGALTARGEPLLVPAAKVPRAGAGEAVITDAPELLEEPDSWGAQVPVVEDSSEAVARLARAQLVAGATDETYSLAPDYLRPPSVNLKPDARTGRAGKAVLPK